VRVIHDDALPVADTAQDVAHLVEADFLEAKLGHLRANVFTDLLQLSIHAGNGTDLAHETNNVFAILFNLFLDFLNCHIYLVIIKMQLGVQSLPTLEIFGIENAEVWRLRLLVTTSSRYALPHGN
jgi:hypothetical protein